MTKPKQKPGPKPRPADTLGRYYSIYLTIAQHAEIKRLAEGEMVGFSEYVRKQCLTSREETTE